MNNLPAQLGTWSLFIVSKILPALSLLFIALFIFILSQRYLSNPYSQDKYYAVFLNNGKVYFGKVSDNLSENIVLSDIYYLQVDRELQNITAGNSDPDVTLVKRGNELHEPSDRMIIPNSNVLFVEELKDSSKIISAINKFNQ